MFNIGTGELAVIFLMALLVLGPDKLPGAARQAGKYLAEFRRISSGFQQEFRDAMDLDSLSPSTWGSDTPEADTGTGNFSLPAIDAEAAGPGVAVDTTDTVHDVEASGVVLPAEPSLGSDEVAPSAASGSALATTLADLDTAREADPTLAGSDATVPTIRVDGPSASFG